MSPASYQSAIRPYNRSSRGITLRKRCGKAGGLTGVGGEQQGVLGDQLHAHGRRCRAGITAHHEGPEGLEEKRRPQSTELDDSVR
jgi:hypothetical protein